MAPCRGEEGLAKGRMGSPQQSFRSLLPGWATCPKRLSPPGEGGSPPRGFSNGHHFSEGAGRRDKTTVTRGP